MKPLQGRAPRAAQGKRSSRSGRVAIAGLAVSMLSAGTATAAAMPHRAVHRSAPHGTLTVAIDVPPTTLSPQPFQTADSYFEWALYQPLVDIQGTKDVPVLATSWKFGHAERSLTLDLRKGVKFSDGTPFTASIAAWNINWVKQPATNAQAVAEWADVTPKVLGRYKLRLDFTRPMPDIFGMLSEAVMVKPNGEDQGIGTGPFSVASNVPGTSLTLRRNTHYWGKAPGVNHIAFKVYPDPATAALALQSGAADLVIGPSFTQVKSLEGQGFKYMPIPGSGASDILVNVSSPPLNNEKVREALSLAFDRKEFVQVATEGIGKPRYSIFAPTSPAFTNSDNKGSYSLTKAKQLLNEAGYKSLNLSIITTATQPQTAFLPIYQQDLAQIGVKLSISVVDTAAWHVDVVDGKFPQLIAHGYNFCGGDPALCFTAFPFRIVGNPEHFVSSKYQSMVQHAGIAGRASTRVADYEAIDRFVQQQAFVIPLASSPTPMVFNKSVQGLGTVDGIGVFYSNVHLGK